VADTFQIGVLRVTYLGHASFQAEDTSGHVVLLDPFFADTFPWGDHVERRLTPARSRPEDVRHCDGIFVSHDHADHWDRDAVASIVARTSALLIGPEAVVRDAIAGGIDERQTCAVQPGDWYSLGGDDDLRVGVIPDESCGDAPLPDKVSYLLRTAGTTVFYSGDCHTLPPALLPYAGQVDAAIVWHKPELVDALVAEVRPRTILLMHYDEFEPGDFPSGGNPEEMRQAILERHPALTVLHSGPSPRR